ncbi:hypothetical protein [Micromonospora sp. WMMD980]|uniref:hypothetical protein n=1 Tax=Micromonospora sp. WMMD980 TaxID=3016088 RepID=UPI0024161B89|nr:hypothetical protein [Micromonospora sp. WMMD980]MDG4801723.1 hypothetical protein [Micromonospora sp. WMMD980]
MPYGTTPTDVLLADVYGALTGEPHPLRPKPEKAATTAGDPDMFARLRAARDRIRREREAHQ